MGSIGSTKGTVNNFNSMSYQELNDLYDKAVENRDRNLMLKVMTELASRPEPTTESKEISYTSNDIRRRGTRGR